jgi:hypothetical protein
LLAYAQNNSVNREAQINNNEATSCELVTTNPDKQANKLIQRKQQQHNNDNASCSVGVNCNYNHLNASMNTLNETGDENAANAVSVLCNHNQTANLDQQINSSPTENQSNNLNNKKIEFASEANLMNNKKLRKISMPNLAQSVATNRRQSTDPLASCLQISRKFSFGQIKVTTLSLSFSPYISI